MSSVQLETAQHAIDRTTQGRSETIVGMRHDRLHAREPTHDRDRWTHGVIRELSQQDGHVVVTVESPTGELVDLVVTLAVRDLFMRRLDIEADESPVGESVWYRKKRA